MTIIAGLCGGALLAAVKSWIITLLFSFNIAGAIASLAFGFIHLSLM